MEVKLINVTQDAEALMAYCARVSSPHQDNPEYSKLLSYCIKHGHWSVFEQADMTVEITTSRAIATQILRHRSFCFQEFSQRYAAATEFEYPAARRQDDKNRQSSHDDLSKEDKAWWEGVVLINIAFLETAYEEALERGIAKECARMILPLCTQTKLYMKGNVRSWIHYLQVRTGPETQLEHREIALAIKEIFDAQFPTVATALALDQL